jgi:predicted nucleotidyltransferase component of viral defense system
MEILTSLQKRFLQEFFKTYLGEKFFLGAGTALAAFYLQHRRSEDLDLFTLDQDLNFDEVNAEINKINRQLDLRLKHHVSTPTFLQFILETPEGEELKVDVIREIPVHFGEIQDFDGIKSDSLENIAVSKLLSIYGRFDGKDFADLYFLIKEKDFDFDELLKRAKKKYPGLNELYLAGNITDVELLPVLPEMLKPFKKGELVRFFQDLAQKLFQKLKPE